MSKRHAPGTIIITSLLSITISAALLHNHTLMHRLCLSKQHHTEPVASTAYQSSLSPSLAKKSSSSVATGGDVSNFSISAYANKDKNGKDIDNELKEFEKENFPEGCNIMYNV
eukprot:SAG31_NODE_2122_length_6404_cov_4.297383_4_plen_113_part_00